jgi:Subtilase family
MPWPGMASRGSHRDGRRAATSTCRRTSRSVVGTAAIVLVATALAATLPATSASAAGGSHVRVAPTKAQAAAARVCQVATTPGHYSCFAMRRTDLPAVPATGSNGTASFTPQVGPAGLHPSQLTAAYGLPSSTGGQGQTVYIVDAYNYPNAEADLAVYRAQFGLPACTTANGCFRKVNQNGAASPLPISNQGWSGEMALDLAMVSAICPNCHITLIEANDSSINMLVAVARANTMGAKFVSMSWGGAESASAPNFDGAYFAPTGVVYTASSGDSGYAGGVIYPASSNRVIAVGGTSLTPAASTRGWAETAWSGAGSGCSAYEAKPAWQGAVSACATRAGTDISAVADPNTGVSVYFTYGTSGGWAVYGGTSAAAPIVAAAYALAGQQPGGVNPAKSLYSQPSKLYDVTSGSNGSCSPAVVCHAGVGWDGPTGLGSPHGITAFKTSRATNPTAVVAPYRLRPPSNVTGSVVSPFWGRRPISTVVNAAVPATD